MDKKTVLEILLTLSLIGILASASTILVVRADPIATVFIYPPRSTALIGEAFTVDVTVADIFIQRFPRPNYGLHMWFLNMTFDPAIITVTSVQKGSFLGTAGIAVFLPPIMNNTAGYVWAGEMLLPPYPLYGAIGGGILATISFQVKSEGRTLLDFVETKLQTCFLGNIILIDHIAEDGVFDNRVITATVDISPEALNLHSMGQWVSCFIELPNGYDVTDVDVSTVMLNGTIPVFLLDVPAPHPVPTEIGDYDNDTIPDLMVKFDRAMISELILSRRITNGYVTLSITGEVNGAPFRGEDTIRVLMAGGGTKGHK